MNSVDPLPGHKGEFLWPLLGCAFLGLVFAILFGGSVMSTSSAVSPGADFYHDVLTRRVPLGIGFGLLFGALLVGAQRQWNPKRTKGKWILSIAFAIIVTRITFAILSMTAPSFFEYQPTAQEVTAAIQERIGPSSEDRMARTSMNVLYDFYIANSWAIENYCKTAGVPVTAYIAAFREANTPAYTLAHNVLVRLNNETEDQLYQTDAPVIFQQMREKMDYDNAKLHITAAQHCQSLQDNPAAAMDKLVFAKIEPFNMKTLQDSQ